MTCTRPGFPCTLDDCTSPACQESEQQCAGPFVDAKDCPVHRKDTLPSEKPQTGMELSAQQGPTRGEATVRELRLLAAYHLESDHDRELVQHAADMLEIALRSATSRNAIIEECAKVCDEEYRHYSGAVAGAYADAAARIRRLDRSKA